MFIKLILSYILHSAPSGAPQNITATTLSPTEIRVEWKPVDAIDRNGIITHYEVQFNQTTLLVGEPLTDAVNTTLNDTNFTLTNLEEYVQYTVTVRAFTMAGVGPYSSFPDSARTDEAGVFKYMFYTT